MANILFDNGILNITNADKEEWFVEIKEGDFSLSKNYGFGNDSVKVNLPTDSEFLKRKGKARIKYNGIIGNGFEEIEFVYSYFQLYCDTVTFNGIGEIREIPYTSSTNVNYETDLEGVSISINEDVIQIESISNDSFNGTITFTNDDGLSKDVIVEQIVDFSLEAVFPRNDKDIYKIEPSIDKPKSDTSIEIDIY